VLFLLIWLKLLVVRYLKIMKLQRIIFFFIQSSGETCISLPTRAYIVEGQIKLNSVTQPRMFSMLSKVGNRLVVETLVTFPKPLTHLGLTRRVQA
jgi:hypothetical protein